jgi:hypothetical protein
MLCQCWSCFFHWTNIDKMSNILVLYQCHFNTCCYNVTLTSYQWLYQHWTLNILLRCCKSTHTRRGQVCDVMVNHYLWLNVGCNFIYATNIILVVDVHCNLFIVEIDIFLLLLHAKLFNHSSQMLFICLWSIFVLQKWSPKVLRMYLKMKKILKMMTPP